MTRICKLNIGGKHVRCGEESIAKLQRDGAEKYIISKDLKRQQLGGTHTGTLKNDEIITLDSFKTFVNWLK